MNVGWPAGYTEWGEFRARDRRCRAWWTGNAADPVWDEFVENTPLGQFQQTGRWAVVKRAEGWHPARLLVTRGGIILGGGQILWRSQGPLRIGYVTKGPVVSGHDAGAVELVLDGLLGLVRQLRMAALIVQPPDFSEGLTESLRQRGFRPEMLMGVIGATLITDLSDGMAAVEARMRQTMRNETRQARRRGVVVREGTRDELPTFFQLMCLSCDRQGEAGPNPASVRSLETIWDAFGSLGCRMTMAEVDGKPVAGLFCVSSGRRVTLWKKGTLPSAFSLRPVPLLYHEAMTWATSKGYQMCDFGGLRHDIALALQRGEPLSEEQMRSRDFFNLGYGGYPVILPPALVTFANPCWRFLYEGAVRVSWLRQVAKNWVR